MSENSDKQEKTQSSQIAEPYNLSKRAKWLRDYYFKGVEREWNNQYMAFTTGTD